MGCVRACSCTYDCKSIDASWVGGGITSPHSSTGSGDHAWPVFEDFSSSDSDAALKQTIACFTGQCRSTPSGDGGTIGSILTHPTAGFSTWGDTNDGVSASWWCAAGGHLNQIAPNIDTGYAEMGWHVWGYGASLWVTTGNELGRYASNGCGTPCPEQELFMIRYAR